MRQKTSSEKRFRHSVQPDVQHRHGPLRARGSPRIIAAALSLTAVSQNWARSSAECSGNGRPASGSGRADAYPGRPARRAARAGSARHSIVAAAPAVPVAGAQVHELAVAPGVDLLRDAREARVKAVVEAHLDQPPAGTPAGDQAVDLRGGRPRRLPPPARAPRPPAPARSARLVAVVDDCHDDDRLRPAIQQLRHRRARMAAVALGQAPGRQRIDVTAGDQLVAG